MTITKSKTMLIATAILVAAILSFTACNKDEGLNPHNPHNPKSNGQDYTKFTLQFMSDEFQSSEFINDILEGRIVSIEWIWRTALIKDRSDMLIHFGMLEELSKQGEVWFEENWTALFQDGYEGHNGNPITDVCRRTTPQFRFKFEKHPEISGAILVTQYNPQRHGLTNELYEWREETSLYWVLTERNGVVYKFRAPGQFETSGWYWVDDLYIKQPGTVDRMVNIGSIGLADNPDNLSAVIESAFNNTDIDLFLEWGLQYTLSREPHQFKITRK